MAATTSDSSYFPSADKCLAGETRLVSWRTAYRAISDEDSAVHNTHLQQFLNDSQTISLLSAALDPFTKPTSRSAADFTTKTAPINVSPASNVNYNLDELKEDAQWLSKEVQIEELAALRMAIIEWQERPADQLLITASNGPNPLSGPANLTSSVLTRDSFNFSASTTAAARPTLDFGKQDVRRARLLNVYLSETSHLLKLSADLVGRVKVGKDDTQGIPSGSLRGGLKTTWIDEVAHKIEDTMCASRQVAESEAFCVKCIEKTESLLVAGTGQTSSPKVFTDDPTKAQSYLDARLVDLVSTLRLLLSAIYALDGVPSATTVQNWFLTMERHLFLGKGDSPLADLSVPQALASVISVEILKVQLVTGEILNAAGVDAPALKGASYIKDERCIAAMNSIFYGVTQLQLSIAAPALWAWAIITSTIREIAVAHRERNSHLIEQGDSGSEGHMRSARRGSKAVQSEFEKLYDQLCSPDMEEHRDDPPQFFAAESVDRMRVFVMMDEIASAVSAVFSSASESSTAFIGKATFFDLIRQSLPFVQYGEELLQAILSLLEPRDGESSQAHSSALAGKFLRDFEQLRPAVLDQALARYPYELSPVLRLFTLLAGAQSGSIDSEEALDIAQILDRLTSFTRMLPESFRSYDLENEDDNINMISLTAPLSIFGPNEQISRSSQRAISMGDEEGDSSAREIPNSTVGIVVREPRPFIVKFEHEHSGLEYLGLLLSSFTANNELVPMAAHAEVDRITATETITLFTALLKSSLNRRNGQDVARNLLCRISSVLRGGQDIVNSIADIFENELFAHLDQVAEPGSVELAASCADFLTVLVGLSPERTWSILNRSSLLGLVNGASSLASVVGGTEVQLGRYNFLAACVKLHSVLLSDAVAGLVKRKSLAPKARNRFESQTQGFDATPERTMSAVLNAYQKILIDALQSMPSWKFDVPVERCNITTDILDDFNRLLISTYGIGTGESPSSRLTLVLIPAAAALLDAAAPANGPSPLVATYSRTLSEGLPVASDSTPMQFRKVVLQQTSSGLRFLVTLVRAAKSGIKLLSSATGSTDQQRTTAELRAKNLSSGVLQSMPILASLLASDHAFKADLFPLLTEVVQSVASGDEDPPSMLAQLDAEAAKAFLMVVTQLDRPLCDVAVERQIWDFLSVVMESKQHWFAIYLLTGALPKTRAHRLQSETIKGKPILNYALDQLSSIAVLPPKRAISMLKFVAVAQQTWVWATNELRTHAEFLKNTLAWLNTLSATKPKDTTTAAALISARECEMAACLCEILAINLHTSLEVGDKTVLKTLAPKLSFLRDHAVAVDAYNRSNHQNLAANIKSIFPQRELSDFERTAVNPAPLGEDFFYDRDIATTVLRHHSSWFGVSTSKDQGFVDEFPRVNANLSLLYAQTALLRSWKRLATTLCECVGQDAALQSDLAKVAENCLLANTDPTLDQPGVADVLQLRLELAFVITSKLVALQANGDFMKPLLAAAWGLVRTSPVDYDVATAAEDMRYYRELLQVLYLTIQPHSYMKSRPTPSHATQETEPYYLHPTIASILVDIVGKVITPGFRALCGNLHNNIELALPADFALLTALLQAILTVPGITSVWKILSDIIAGSSVVRGALSLYSWADQLAEEMHQDPIYGEIAIAFLLSLSTVRPVAEQMALEGVLTQVSAANLSNYFRKPGGKGPFDEPQRMFAIWSEGFLPLCLNLVDSVGPPIAGEVASFLNTFREQLQRAEKSLQNENPGPRNPRAGTVTLGLVTEAHSLLMIAFILNSDTARAAADGINAADIPALEYDFEGVKGLTESLVRSKRSLADRIAPTSPLEERWSKTSVSGASDNLLMQKILKELVSMQECFGGESD
ncbi:unnamed protein product [Zymoseptoria tritici ST99CH_1A5]|uniref:Uncharacterized protein n=1 Tax=Zymoseptoria tritici ST99CH_1A5 TaxID=1276529 RepID=A0A1Y6L4Z5_ZYMTR|nr:unnamed protein product [Zymoseptoria tritici ST99CH_1A5]